MTSDLFLILEKEVQGGKLTPEQSIKIGGRYLEIQAFEWATEGEKSEIFKAFVAQVVYPDGDPELPIWRETAMKVIEHLQDKKQPGQQTLIWQVEE